METIDIPVVTQLPELSGGAEYTTRFLYDAQDRRTYTIYADNSWTLATYDALGRRIAETDQNTNTTWFGYDGLGRLVSVTNALGNVTAYSYNEVGNRLTRTSSLPGVENQSLGYDPNDRLTTDGYDANGNTKQGQFTVYNFEVEEFHSYFVGESGILGHNRCTQLSFFDCHHSLPKFLGGDPDQTLTYLTREKHQELTKMIADKLEGVGLTKDRRPTRTCGRCFQKRRAKSLEQGMSTTHHASRITHHVSGPDSRITPLFSISAFQNFSVSLNA